MNRRNNNPERAHEPVAAAAPEDGYILLVLILFSALIVIGLLQAIPRAMVQGQREREEEVIFRGQEYQRAIQAYVRRFGRYPNSLEELENTNRIRFLRRRYRDPLTKEGKWRFIHVGPGGTFPDAKTNMALPTQPQAAANLGLPLSPEMQKSSGAAQPSPGARGGTAGVPGMTPVGTSPAAAPSSFPPGLSPAGGATPALPPAFSPSANPAANPSQQPRAAATVQQQQQNPSALTLGAIGGGAIAGVASLNTGEGIKVWKGYSKYEEWEFIYDFRQDPFGLAAVARVSGVAGQPIPQPGVAPAQPVPASTSPQPATTPGFGATPFPGAQPPYPGLPYPGSQPSPFPGGQAPYPGAQPAPFPGTQPPGVRPYQPQFPPSPIPTPSPRR